MKKIFTTLFFALTCLLQVSAQAPNGFNYQSILRDDMGIPLSFTEYTIEFEILQGSPEGTAVYTEDHDGVTGDNGIVNLVIGDGFPVTGDVFTDIDWSQGPYFLSVAVDYENSGTLLYMGVSQLLSVPYALYAENAGNAEPGPKGDKGEKGDQGDSGLLQAGTKKGEMTYWDGANWVYVAPGKQGQNLTMCDTVPTWGPCPLEVGDMHEGGIIVYLLKAGDAGYDANVQHGVIAALQDQSEGIKWGCWNAFITGADDKEVGTGDDNTNDILNECSDPAIAAKICFDLELNGYDDWFLPSYWEMFHVRNVAPNINTEPNIRYWSSSEYNNDNAFTWRGSDGLSQFRSKNELQRVRAVRYF